jgi:hypothetical protein
MTDSKFDPQLIPLPNTDYMEPLGTVREALRETLATGEVTTCPCCGGTAKVYSRPINATMARILKAVTRSPNGMANTEINTKVNPAGGGDAGKLAHWGLIEKVGDHWIATEAGRDFAYGRSYVYERALIYNNTLLGFDTRTKTHIDRLGGRIFDKDDVMSAEAVRQAEVSHG